MEFSAPIIKRLLQHNFFTLEQVQGIKIADSKASVVQSLIDGKLITADKLAEFCSKQFGQPLLDLQEVDLNSVQLPEELNKESLIRKHQSLPLLKKGRKVLLAVPDPTNINAIEDFEFSSGLQMEIVVCNLEHILKAIEKIFEKSGESFGLTESDVSDLAEIDVAESDEPDTNNKAEVEDGPIVLYINKILNDAIRKGASDLHFEPYEQSYRVRFRIDGILHEVAHPPVGFSKQISARIKVMSRLDIAEKRKPQDGRIKLKLNAKKSIDFRVSTLPTLWGEKIVMRILDSSSAMLGIDILGYEKDQKELYLKALAQPQGMILVTGPTGSGKTVSLYTGLNILNTPEVNISTAEDPVEINLPGINQVQINTRADLTFASALRSFLRQDPDVVMVGEIRDLETAEIAIKAAQTGHLVLSTLHTNSAPETLTRLANMGVPAYNIASSVSLIIAQRLARRLCNNCKQPESIPHDELLRLGYTESQIPELKLFKAGGCDMCTDGYKGRLGVYEVMPITPAIAQVIMQGGNSLEIAEIAAKEGVRNLRKSGLIKAANGLTSLAEINRVTNF